MRNLFLMFIAFILAEITAIILVGNWFGVFPTLLLLIATSALGVYLLKKRGTQSLKEIQSSIANGQPPGVALMEAFMMFVGAVLLILPGFLSDVFGLLMFTSATRSLFKPLIFMWLRKKMKNQQMIIVQR